MEKYYCGGVGEGSGGVSIANSIATKATNASALAALLDGHS